MKGKDILLIGAIGLGAYFLLSRSQVGQAQTGAASGGSSGFDYGTLLPNVANLTNPVGLIASTVGGTVSAGAGAANNLISGIISSVSNKTQVSTQPSVGNASIAAASLLGKITPQQQVAAAFGVPTSFINPAVNKYPAGAIPNVNFSPAPVARTANSYLLR